MQALGMIETAGYSTALYAADAALKAAKVRLTGIERVVGAAGSLGVTVHLEGDVAAVRAAVAAGAEAGRRVGTVVSEAVIARVHDDVRGKILPLFQLEVAGEVATPEAKATGSSQGEGTT